MRALSRCQLAGFDALREPPQFAQGHVERFLGPLGAAAGIAEHAGPIAQGVVAGIDAVAQPAALADLGEQPRAHAAAQGPHGAPGLKIVGMAIGHARSRRCRCASGPNRRARAGNRPGPDARRRAPSAGCQSPSNLPTRSFKRLPLDAAGHAQDRAAGLELPLKEAAYLLQADRLQGLLLAQRRAAPGVGKMAAAKLDHDLFRRLVFHRPQALQHGSAGRPPTPRPAGAAAATRRQKWPGPRAGSRPSVAPP